MFLVYHGFSEESGISKKIHYQVKGLRQNGHEVHLCYYDFDSQGNRCRYIDGKIIANYGKGRLAAFISRINLACIYKYCMKNGIEMVYARSFMNASPMLVWFFAKLKKAGIKSVTEVPTFPYDSEFKGYPLKNKISLFIDKVFRKLLAEKMEAIVTFSNEKTIFGKRTICISNGIDLDSIPLHNPQKQTDINFIAVAEIHYWHGFDRFVAGLGEYYKCNPDGRKVYFHVVGWEDDRGTTSNGYLTIGQTAKKYGIEKYVIQHGRLFGEQLDEVFNKSVFAIGSLGRHRSGITDIKTLKNREYAARGIPFIYSENDSDFDDKPYIIKASANDAPLDVLQIINFIDNRVFNPLTIRESIIHLSWKHQMQLVLDTVLNNSIH